MQGIARSLRVTAKEHGSPGRRKKVHGEKRSNRAQCLAEERAHLKHGDWRFDEREKEALSELRAARRDPGVDVPRAPPLPQGAPPN